MSFSRISVLAVFFMMVMSAFVVVPTYNVGADEHEDGPYLNAFPTDSGGDIEDYEMSLDENEGGASITVEATELIDGADYMIHWEIRSYDPSTPENTNVDIQGDKSFSSPPTSFDFTIGSDILNDEDEDLDPGCYMFYAFLKEDLDDDDDEEIIEEEDWPFTLDMPMSECGVDGDDGFDIHRQEITVEMVSLSEWDLHLRAFVEATESDEFRDEIASWCQSTGIVADVETEGITASCFDAFMENEFNEHGDDHGCPSDLTEEQCEIIQDCEDDMSMVCFEVFYDICIIGDGGEFCDEVFGDGDLIYYCSNGGEDYAESMGGILCPEGPDVVPMCPNDEPCVCIDIDGSCDDGDDDWGYYDDDDIMLDLIFEAIAYDRGDNSSSELIDFVSEILDGLFGDNEDPPDIAYYDVHEFNITEDEVANYTIEIGHTYNEETGEHFEPSVVYLYEGLWEDDPMPSDAYWIDGSYRVCEYVDYNDFTYVSCSHTLSSQVDVGSYSLFVTNSCHHIWEYNEDSDSHEFEGYDCHYGEYTLSITNDDNGSSDDVTGNITAEDSFFEYEDVHLSHIIASEEYNYFPYYEAKPYTLTEGSDVAYFHADKEEDHMQNVYVWLYEGSFNASNWSENLMYVSSGHENGDPDDMDSHFDMSNFEPGDYVFVTTGEHTHQNGSSYEAGIYDSEGTPLVTWGGTLCGDDNNLCEDPDETDDRAYFTHENNPYFQNYHHDDDDDGEDSWFEFFFSPLLENMTSYENGDITDTDFANKVVDLLYYMSEMGYFEDDDDDDVPSPEEVIEFADANGDDQVSYQEFQDAWQQEDESEDLNWDDVEELFNDADTNDDDLLSHDELYHFIDGIVAMTSDDDDDDDDECPFTNQDFCRELEHMCNAEEDGGDHERCGRKVAHYCLENEDPGCAEVVTACTPPINAENASICEAYTNFDHDDYHGNDGMPQLDGIPGAPQPHNWSEDLLPSDENIVGMLGENQGKELQFIVDFLLFFEDVDETLDQHAFSTPPEDGEFFNCRTEPGMEGEEMTIPFNKVNDGTEDCGDGADEPQYDEDEEEINWFDCSGDESVGHVEISMTKVNDGNEDCPYGDDELDNDPYTINFRVLDTYKIEEVSCTSCPDVDYSDDDTFVSFDGEGPFTIYFSEVSEEDDCPIENQTWCDDAEVVCDDEHADTNATACAELVVDYCEAEGIGHEFCVEVDELCASGAYPDDSEDVWGDWEVAFCEAYNGVDEPEPLLPLYGTKIYNVTHVNDQVSESLGMGVYTQNGFKIDDDNSFDAFVFSNNWWIVYFPTDLHDIDAGFVLVNDGPVFDAIAELRAQNADPSYPNFTVDGQMTFQIDIVDGNLITPQKQTIIMWSSEPEPEPEPDLVKCDHVVGLTSMGDLNITGFDKRNLTIKVGETVCWQWTDAALAHNVVEIDADAYMTIQEEEEADSSELDFADFIDKNGFSSGVPSTTVDFRYTFTEDNSTHYYACELHWLMIGRVIVGEGTPDDPVQEALDEAGIPSIGFVVGALMLVGAAGLRRRIH